jgi:hypothetical protein
VLTDQDDMGCNYFLLNSKLFYMTTLERNDSNDAARIIQTLGVLFMAIVLKGYSTGYVTGQWTIVVMTIIAAVFVGNAVYWNASR